MTEAPKDKDTSVVPKVRKAKGLIIVHTGNGKGKTTAAMGTALRAVGAGMKVCMIQFIKGAWKYGEMDAVKRLGDFEILPMGKGFTWDTKNPEEDRRTALVAWEECKRRALSGDYQLVIFDEINYVIDYGFIPAADVVAFLKAKPEMLHLILTGRNAHPDVVEVADLVTEMKEIKHPFKQGIVAQRGIEF